MSTVTTPKPASTDTDTGTTEPPLLHLVLKSDWPMALCGATVKGERWTSRGAGCDRCARCLEIARDRNLGRPGWV